MNNSASYLFAGPSFIEGLSRVFDPGGTLNEYNRSDEPDVLAMWADWSAVAEELNEAISKFEADLSEKESDA
jgi:hypothetical protein